MKLLLAVDDERRAMSLRAMLSMDGHEACCVTDGASALAALSRESYDAGVLDASLPGLNGYEVTRIAREQKIRTPILLLTTKDSPEEQMAAHDAGADDSLPETFQTKELLARVHTISR